MGSRPEARTSPPVSDARRRIASSPLADGDRPARRDRAAPHLFCELYVRLLDVGLTSDGAFASGLTQADVGDALSRSAVHVNRVVQELRTRGLVSWDRRGVVIKDWDAPSVLAEFGPTYPQLDDQVET